MAVRKLVISNLLSRKVRAALTIAAVALAVSLVVSVTSGYASIEAAVYKYLNQYLGTIDVEIVRANDPAVGTSEDLVDQVRADPDVEKVDARYETHGTPSLPDGTATPNRVALIGVRRPQDKRSDYLKVLAGGWGETAGGDWAVIDPPTAASLGLA